MKVGKRKLCPWSRTKLLPCGWHSSPWMQSLLLRFPLKSSFKYGKDPEKFASLYCYQFETVLWCCHYYAQITTRVIVIMHKLPQIIIEFMKNILSLDFCLWYGNFVDKILFQ